MKEYIDFSNKYTSIRFIILYFIIFISVVTVIFKKNIKNYVEKNWKHVRCKPYMLPFVGLSKYAEGNNYFKKSTNTFNSCTDTLILKLIKVTTTPFIYLAQLIIDILNKFSHIIKIFKKQSELLHKIFKSIIKNTTGRIEDNISTSLYLHEKLKNIIKKQNAMVEITKHFISSFPVLLYSFSHGPIPRFANWLTSYINMLSSVLISCMLCNFSKRHCIRKDTCPVCALCFDENTLIQIDDYHSIPINKLKINDKIKGGIVLGIIKVKNTLWDLYNYNDIIVSGNHLVYENKWIRVENSRNSIPISHKCSLFCLITSSHEIHIKNIKFKDYQELDDLDILNQINYNVLNSCNQNKIYIKTKFDENHVYQWGFHENTLVKVNDTYMKIIDIINNNVYDDNIIGSTKITVNNEKFYNIDGIVTTGSCIIKLDDIWQRVHQTKYPFQTETPTHVFNLITKNNIIEIQGDNKIYTFRDYVESFDNELNDSIDKLIENRLNKLI